MGCMFAMFDVGLGPVDNLPAGTESCDERNGGRSAKIDEQ